MREKTTQESCSMPIGVTSHTTLLSCGGEGGGGATPSWIRSVRKNALLNQCAL